VNRNIQLRAEQALLLKILGNSFDQGAENTMIFEPTGQGLDSVIVSDNWIASENDGKKYGTALLVDNGNPSVGLMNFIVSSNAIRFASIGVFIKSTTIDAIISGNTFAAIQSFGIVADQSIKTTISNNTFDHVASNLFLRDGENGGPIIIDGNQFDTSAGYNITKTLAAKFKYGNTNTGMRLP
jgi:hypothetical protein